MDHGKLADSAGLMRQSLEIYELAFGPDHQLTVDVESQLLGLLHAVRRLCAANALEAKRLCTSASDEALCG